MRDAAFGLLAFAVFALSTMACSDRLPTDPARPASAAESAAAGPGRSRGTIVVPPRGIEPARFGTWGSDVASLTIQPAGAVLKVLGTNLGSGGCYGSFGEVARSIPIGRCAFPGTCVQRTGVYPGRIEYGAGYEGVIEGDVMTLTVTVPSLPRALG